MQRSLLEEFTWTPQPAPASLVLGLVNTFCRRLPEIDHLAQRMLSETGTRLIDWIDHIALPVDAALGDVTIVHELPKLGFSLGASADDSSQIWQHDQGLFPRIRLSQDATWRLALKVESVCDFLEVHCPGRAARAAGRSSCHQHYTAAAGRFHQQQIASRAGVELWAVERHGWPGFSAPAAKDVFDPALVERHAAAFRTRRRDFDRDEDGFNHASRLVAAAVADLGVDLTCDLFFAAERDYWQWRNRAGQAQRIRQDALGLGWANHDHHTYRSSRKHFTRLIAVLEQLGFVGRERFYGGHGAGWGAQVLQQSNCGVVIFADVDLTPEELSGDFAHQPLPDRDKLSTVGLWCRLHGEAFLQAGMHHLECQFDFAAAREQLAAQGVASMKPFTDFDYLKQSFTQGDNWPVEPWRIAALLEEGLITAEQADKFRREGALGSHLEILQRDDGYKGFNQTGISEIIRSTDPRLS